MSDPIDFGDLAAALLERAEQLVPQWLPGGKRRGHEWVCGGLSGEEGSSCSVNLVSGKWADFASDERGSDLIALYAEIHGLSNSKAARELMKNLGWERSSSSSPAQTSAGDPRPAPPAEGTHGKKRTNKRPVVPVPPTAPAPDFWHYARKPEDIQRVDAYRLAGALFGYVVRFRTSDGGKEILPHTWCVDESDDRGTAAGGLEAMGRAAAALRAGHAARQRLRGWSVVLVEGEKCARPATSCSGTSSTS
jgi:putative DNA primase/helicase